MPEKQETKVESKEAVKKPEKLSEMIKDFFQNFGKMNSSERMKTIGKILFAATIGKYISKEEKEDPIDKTEKEDETGKEEERESNKTDKPEEPNQSIDPSLVGPVPGGVEPLCRRGKVVEDHTHNAKLLEIDPKKMTELETVKERYAENKSKYDEVARLTDIPAILICALHYRESNCRFGTYLHNGQPLGKTTTYVPAGILFRKGEWVKAAAHALGGDIKDANGKPSLKAFRRLRDKFGINRNTTDMGVLMAFSEHYNGLGYRRRGIRSCYVYAGTNLNQKGRYVSDGKFDPNSVDRRLGTAAILMGLQTMTFDKPLRVAGKKTKSDKAKAA